MNKNDDLQYMPLMHGRVSYTDEEFKKTNIKNHGVQKGTVRWNYKKFVTTMVLTGSIFGVAIGGGIHAFNTMKGAPKETTVAVGEDRVRGTGMGEEVDNTYSTDATNSFESNDVVVTQVEKEPRVITDYKVQAGDTLDGIIYGYTSGATEEKYYKDFVTFYNNIDGDMIRMGDVITLVGVPESEKEDYNTGYDENFNKNDEISINLNAEVQDLLNEYGNDYAVGSLLDTIVKELEVFNATTSKKTREYLASLLVNQIESVRKYGNDVTSTYEAAEDKGRSR